MGAQSSSYFRWCGLLALLLTTMLAGCTGSMPDPVAERQDEGVDQPSVIETGYFSVSDGTRLRYHLERLDGAPPGPVTNDGKRGVQLASVLRVVVLPLLIHSEPSATNPW